MKDRERLNQAIWDVISTQFKKDAREAHKTVEDAGYTIDKQNGAFIVRNPKTYGYVTIDEGIGFDTYRIITRHGAKGFKTWGQPPVDFVGVVDAEYNWEYYSQKEAEERLLWSGGKARQAWRRIHDLRYSIKQDVRNIAQYEKEIEEAKRNYERALRNKTEDEEKLRQILAEYGLTGRRTA